MVDYFSFMLYGLIKKNYQQKSSNNIWKKTAKKLICSMSMRCKLWKCFIATDDKQHPLHFDKSWYTISIIYISLYHIYIILRNEIICINVSLHTVSVTHVNLCQNLKSCCIVKYLPRRSRRNLYYRLQVYCDATTINRDSRGNHICEDPWQRQERVAWLQLNVYSW